MDCSVHITVLVFVWPQKYVSRVETGAARVSHVTRRKIVTPDAKEHVKGCHVTDTPRRTLLQQELRHRQLTVGLELS